MLPNSTVHILDYTTYEIPFSCLATAEQVLVVAKVCIAAQHVTVGQIVPNHPAGLTAIIPTGFVFEVGVVRMLIIIRRARFRPGGEEVGRAAL